jgi:hypothetical protein
MTREEAVTAIRDSEALGERLIEAMPDEMNSATAVMALANVFDAVMTITEQAGGASAAEGAALFHHRLDVLRERRKKMLAEAS